ncbi:MAG: SDR family oxidoreductase, partial [Candidatus Eremiobacteraeota bacterium]|nr:SDR family oxidoreductase [Candidatus Eremiobacteraeota bacterium]
MQAALITGAGSERGIGRATARVLAERGFAIAILDIDEISAKRVAEELQNNFGVSAIGLPCNVTDEASVDAAVTKVEAALPPLTALINNAGITSPTRFLDIAPAEWQKLFDVNVLGVYLVTQRVLRGMAARTYGRIVNLSSVSAERGGGVFGGAHYSATKGAVLGLTRAVAREFAALGITSNAVAPGLIDTDITGGALV